MRADLTAALFAVFLSGCGGCGDDPAGRAGGRYYGREAGAGVVPSEDSGADPFFSKDASADAGETAEDATTLDAAPTDAGSFDAGSFDAGSFDAGGNGAPTDAEVDASVADAGLPADGGASPDAGGRSSDLWIEIRYHSAFSPASPAWSYSASPGWSPSDWGFQGGSGAEAWDRWNNMSVVDDPIGRSLEIGGSSELQLMLGLVRLQSYSGATVELEGRSRATSSRVFFDVYNPATFCGGAAEMNQDWTPDIVQVDLTGCFEPGSSLQAVRVEPTSGTIALRRMRLTIHGALY